MLPDKVQPPYCLVVRVVQITEVAVGALTMDNLSIGDIILAYRWVGICADWEQVFVCLGVQFLQAHYGVDERLISHVEGRCDTLRRVDQTVLEDLRPLFRQVLHDILLILDLCIDRKADKEEEEKDAEEGEQVNSELVTHRALVPPNLTSHRALALAQTVHIISCLGRLGRSLTGTD